MYKKWVIKLKTQPFREIIVFTLPLTILMIVVITGLVVEGSQQFSELANAFLHGQLNFLSSIGGLGKDPVFFHGKIYWDEGPFPAIILMPFVAFFKIFHLFFYQGYIKWLLELGIMFFVYKLARRLAYTIEDSLILVLGFALGSVFIGIMISSSSWFFSQVLTTFLLFWGLYEFYYKKRWWLIGLICAFILLTRATAAPILLFFVLELWQSAKLNRQKYINFVKLCAPVLMAILIIGCYNYFRFQNPFNGGYEYQLLGTISAGSRSYGVFSLLHIPMNFYGAFLGTPNTVPIAAGSWILKFPFIENNNYGMSIFITSPYLLYLFTLKRSAFDRRTINLLVAIAASCLLVLSYYGLGLFQFGYRYALDFMPALFLLFMIKYRKNHKHLTAGMKALLLGSGIVNFYLLLTFI